MALRELINRKVDRLESVPNTFYSGVARSQVEILNQTLTLLDQLSVTNGLIDLSQQNLVVTQQITEVLAQAVFQTEYQTALVSFAGEFNTQGAINNEYFATVLSKAVEVKEIYNATLLASQADAVALLSQGAVRTEFIQPLKVILDSAVAGNMSLVQAIQTVEDHIIGTPDAEGKLLRYTKQVARDAFSISDRRYTKIVGDDLGFENYLYSGGTVTDSRVFCVERVGKKFTRSEVEAWGNIKQWQGRIPSTNSTNIFELAGGFNCMHSILPVV